MERECAVIKWLRLNERVECHGKQSERTDAFATLIIRKIVFIEKRSEIQRAFIPTAITNRCIWVSCFARLRALY